MTLLRTTVLVGVFALCGCGSRSDETVRKEAPKVVDTKPSKDTAFEDGACFDCAHAQCAEAITRCEADPGCAAFEKCLWDCPVTDTGIPTSKCSDECTIASNNETEARAQTLLSCIEKVDCVECNEPPSIGLNVADAGPPPDAGQSCTPTNPDSECNVCTWSNCCDIRNQCVDGTECGSFFDCIDACELETLGQCEQQCAQQVPNGRWPFEQLLYCGDAHCGSICGAKPNPCADCARDACSEILLACFADKACWEIHSCATDNCTDGIDPDCIPNCAERSPAGAPAYDTWLECNFLNCQAECSG